MASPKPELFVSLGSDCQVAFNTRETVPTLSGPFDWLVTPFPALLKALDSGFDEFMTPANLIDQTDSKGKRVVFDKNYGVLSFHDFAPGAPLENQEVQEKYRHLVANLLELLGSDRRVMFIRKDCRRRHASEITGVLRRVAVRLDWTLLAVTPTPEEDWGMARVVQRHLRPTGRWQGNEDEWAKLLAPFHTDREGVIRYGPRNRTAGRARPRAG